MTTPPDPESGPEQRGNELVERRRVRDMYVPPGAPSDHPVEPAQKGRPHWLPRRGEEGSIAWALVYAIVLVGWAVYDWSANPSDGSGPRRLYSFLVLLALALVAGFVEVRSRARR